MQVVDWHVSYGNCISSLLLHRTCVDDNMSRMAIAFQPHVYLGLKIVARH